MKEISARFFGKAGSPKDEMVQSIFETHGGVFLCCKTHVGPAAPERDVCYEVPEDRFEACRSALKKAGARLEPASWH